MFCEIIAWKSKIEYKGRTKIVALSRLHLTQAILQTRIILHLHPKSNHHLCIDQNKSNLNDFSTTFNEFQP